MKTYIKLMRIHHYIKNLLIFAALACSGQVFNRDKFLAGLAGFFAFCMMSSVIYIVNDIQDKERDRLHPTKCSRPIASGMISERKGKIVAFVLIIAAIFCNCLTFHIPSTVLLILYLILNLMYSYGLKNVPIIDVTILVAGFLIRMVYGAFLTEIEISNWLYLTVIALAFYCALGKRRNELKQMADGETRQVLKWYSVNFLDKNMYMCLTLANVFYTLWSIDENTIASYNNHNLFYTAPIVLLITMKYSLNMEGESEGDPVEVLMHDRILMILCVIYLAAMFRILYL